GTDVVFVTPVGPGPVFAGVLFVARVIAVGVVAGTLAQIISWLRKALKACAATQRITGAPNSRSKARHCPRMIWSLVNGVESMSSKTPLRWASTKNRVA